MSTTWFVTLQLLLIAVNLPGMWMGYWWSYLAAGIIMGILMLGLVYTYV